jgi:hypothetical protein
LLFCYKDIKFTAFGIDWVTISGRNCSLFSRTTIGVEYMKNAKNIVLQLSSKLVTLFAALALAGMTESASAGNDENQIKFDLVRSSAVVSAGPNVLPNAQGRVEIESVGPVEIMDVKVSGLPAIGSAGPLALAQTCALAQG